MLTAILVTCISVAATPPDTVVVCPPELLPALQPYLAYRRQQGHRFAVVPAGNTADDVRDTIRRHARSGQLRDVLLVGDADPAAKTNPAIGRRSVPTMHIPAKINVLWGSEPEIATDNRFADLDGDGLPDVALGRLTADSPAELATMVRKILAYEQSGDHGLWRRQINCVAGVGGFGVLVDAVLEMVAKRFLTDNIPAGYATTMTYASWRSPYCPDPRQFGQVTLDRLGEGCLFWVYIGHGQSRLLDYVRLPGTAYPILGVDDLPRLRRSPSLPIALLLACYTGAFDQRRDCLAEGMLRAEGGPVAVLSGSRVTMPYAMAVMSNELLKNYFGRRPATLGQLVLQAKRAMMDQSAATRPGLAPDLNRTLLDAVASVISPNGDRLDEERAEHVAMFNLLGDPLLRLRYPQQVELHVPQTIRAGGRLQITGKSETAGRCTIELVCRRDSARIAAPLRTHFAADDRSLTAFNTTYQQVNDRRWTAAGLRVPAGRFQTELAIPADAQGPCFVRAYVEGPSDFAVGSTAILIRKPPATETATLPPQSPGLQAK